MVEEELESCHATRHWPVPRLWRSHVGRKVRQPQLLSQVRRNKAATYYDRDDHLDVRSSPPLPPCDNSTNTLLKRAMSGHPSGPGKTAPKLYRDFLLFDPLKVSHGRNVLVDHPPPVGEGPQFGYQPGACAHEYATKHAQSILPPLDLRSDGATQFKLAVVCRMCRLHADIYINCSHSTKPCPNEQYPLHHFQFLSDAPDAQRIKYIWQCSSRACAAHLQITFRQPRLTEKDRDLLCNTDRLRRRYETIKANEPEREGMRLATPIDALTRLRRYIRDSLDANQTRRSIPANNKRFQEAFGWLGGDCKELLTRLGFKYAVSLLRTAASYGVGVADNHGRISGNGCSQILVPLSTGCKRTATASPSCWRTWRWSLLR